MTGAVLLLTGEGLLVLIVILAAVQAFQTAPNAEGDRPRSSSSPGSSSRSGC